MNLLLWPTGLGQLLLGICEVAETEMLASAIGLLSLSRADPSLPFLLPSLNQLSLE